MHTCLIQHYVGRCEEGSREVELLARSPQDFETLLAHLHYQRACFHSGNYSIDGRRAKGLENTRLGLGDHGAPCHHCGLPHLVPGNSPPVLVPVMRELADAHADCPQSVVYDIPVLDFFVR